MRVTLRNSYILPFRYKGWYVTVEEKTPFFSDVKVKVTLTVDKPAYINMVHSAIAKSLNVNENDYGKLFSNETYSCIMGIIDKLCDSKSKPTFCISANGGMLDRFLGQNCSAIEKTKKKILEHIDCNIGIAISQKELLNNLNQYI